jgi:hypothetical protein
MSAGNSGSSAHAANHYGVGAETTAKVRFNPIFRENTNDIVLLYSNQHEIKRDRGHRAG